MNLHYQKPDVRIRREMLNVKSVLVELLGDTAKIKVLDFLLIEGRHFEYSLAGIAKNASVSKATLNKLLPTLEEFGILTETRRPLRSMAGQAKIMYMLNTESSLAKGLYNFAMDLAFKKADEEITASATIRSKSCMRL